VHGSLKIGNVVMKNAQGVNTGGAFYVNGVATLSSRICIAFMVYGLWDAHQTMGLKAGRLRSVVELAGGSADVTD
jgi:hypothetical protein